MASLITNPTKKYLLDLAVADATALTVMLLTSSHTTNIDTQDFINDVSGNEITNTAGSAYTAGGKALSNVATSQDDTDNEAVLTGDNLSWTSASFTARYAVLYDNTGTPATSRIWAIYDLGADKISDGGTFLLTINSEGLINLG
jgi:hypothetical protein